MCRKKNLLNESKLCKYTFLLRFQDTETIFLDGVKPSEHPTLFLRTTVILRLKFILSFRVHIAGTCDILLYCSKISFLAQFLAR